MCYALTYGFWVVAQACKASTIKGTKGHEGKTWRILHSFDIFETNGGLRVDSFET
jgi:hypothetical protein